MQHFTDDFLPENIPILTLPMNTDFIIELHDPIIDLITLKITILNTGFSPLKL
jgi:hypothetical protein